MLEQNISTVSDVVGAIKTTLEFEYADILIEGEISNLSPSSAGHYYFTLSDDQSSLSCALFRMDALRNPFIRRAKNGDKVIVRGPISVYAKRGTFQLITKKITPSGKGDLKAQFEILKQKLAKEGLFDVTKKVSIPKLPKRIGVITAQSGAALQDFLNVLKRRCLWYDILIIPAVVQGDNCASSVISSIDKAEAMGDLDVLVITRGGGSMEDLWGFNDESLVRRVAKSNIPIISAIGHQVDFSLLDFVADQRCETPSTAAEFLSQGQTQISDRLQLSLQKLKILFSNFSSELKKRLDRINPLRVSAVLQQRVSNFMQRLERNNLDKRQNLLRLNDFEFQLDDFVSRLERNAKDMIMNSKHRLNIAEKSLFNLNPNQVLSRGYTYIEDKDTIITNIDDFDALPATHKLKIVFKDGSRNVQKE